MNTFRIILVLSALVCALLVSPAPSIAAGPGKACVVMTPAGPALEINSKPTPPAILQTGSMDDLKPGQAEVAWAGKHGLPIVSPTVWGIPWFKDGQTPTLKGTDVARWLDAVVAANPGALLLPRFPVDQPPEWWIKLHPDEMGLFHDGTRRLASVHSLIWRRDAAKQIGHFVRLLEARYGAHMIGYHVCGQNTAEWFYEGFWENMHGGFEPPATAGFRRLLKARYGNDQALARAWGEPKAALSSAAVPGVPERMAAKAGTFRDPASQRRALDFDEFRNAEMADAVAAMCKAVKDAAPHRLAIAFYGYTFELSGSARGGHMALGRLLESPYVDGLCGPYSYADRQSGGAGRFMGPVDSVLAHGKMWFTEDDTRTHLTPADAAPGRCRDARETSGVLARNFAHAMAHGAGLWWMDMTGTGWFASEDIWALNGRLAKNYPLAPGRPRYAPEIAVVVDERSCLYANPAAGESGLVALLSEFRSPSYRIGAPLGYYLLDDVLAGRVPQAKMYIMLNAFRLDDAQRRALRERVCTGGRTVVWMYAPGLIGENALGEANVADVVGISLKTIATGGADIVLTNGGKFNANHNRLSPTFAVDDAQALPLARYAAGDPATSAAVAEKKLPAYTSIYSGVMQLPASLLRSLAKKAGVHIYNDQDQIVTAGGGIVALHATTDGPHSLAMPAPCEATDAVTGESLGTKASFSFDLKTGDTKILRVK